MHHGGSEKRWHYGGLAIYAASTFLLLSFGGAIVAAPITLPLLYLAARRHPTRSFRLASTVIGAFTAAEVGWALAYMAVGDTGPLIWLAPLASAAVAAAVISGTVGPHRTAHRA